MKKQQTPPKWADRFLAWYCNPKLLEQIQGDVHELFYWRLDEAGLGKARRSFIWDVIRLFRWQNIKRTQGQNSKTNNIAMFKNFFKIGLRNLWKQRVSSTINVIGLSLAVGCCIVAFKWIEHTYVKDRFHKNLNDLFLVTHFENVDSDLKWDGDTDYQLIDEILATVPGISKHSRYYYYDAGTKVRERETTTFSLFVDEDYLQMFSFELLEGNINALSQTDQIVINEDAAKRFFGDEGALGKTIELKIAGEWKRFVVGAIMKRKPNNSSMQNYLLVNFDHLEPAIQRSKKATGTNFFIQRGAGVDKLTLETAINKILPVFNQGKEESAYEHVKLEPLSTMAINSTEMLHGVGSAPQLAANLLLGCIGVFMLILATSNYINIATAMAMKRTKEIGVRKVIGSGRSQLVLQFLTENFLLCSLSIFIGCLLAEALFLPGFNKISGASLQLRLLAHTNFIIFLIGLLCFITLVSGLYPAYVAARFKPVVIFRGGNQRGGKKRLTGVLLTFQMILAMITIISAVMFVHTNQQNRNRDWGYNQYDKMVVRLPDTTYHNAFRDKLLENPSVSGVAGTKTLIGRVLNGYSFQLGDSEIYADVFDVGHNYLELLEVRLKSGRFFNEKLKSDEVNGLIVNESFMRSMQLSMDTTDLIVKQDSLQYKIIGVVEDFHYWDFGTRIRPAAMRLVAQSDQYYLMAKTAAGTLSKEIDKVKEDLAIIAPDEQVSVYAQSATFDSYFDEMAGIQNIIVFTAGLAILLSAMGLYGLVSINISSHIKDFGIRKVLGANGFQLSAPVYKRFRYILGIAVVVGVSVSVLVLRALLDSVYGYSEKIGFGPISVAVFILLGVTFLTLNIQVRHVKKLNPAETLRTD